MTAAEPLVIDPETFVLHESASHVDEFVRTSEQCWAYAQLVPFVDKVPPEPAAPFAVVTADIEIAAGRIGFGVTNTDGNTFLAEHHLDEGRRQASIRVPLAGVGTIVFRNGNPAGSSRYRVRRLSVSLAHKDPGYPVQVPVRDLGSERIPAGGGTNVFNDDPAAAINTARMDFVRSLGLPLQGTRVLDVGAGVGHFAGLYSSLGAHVTAIDGRSGNIEELRVRYPAVDARVGDIQATDLRPLGTFDVVHCFGLLYHLDSPVAALRRMEEVCGNVLLLETMVVDSERPVLMLADETFAVNQALAGVGCRPSPSFVVMALNRVGFPYVYGAAVPPDHPDFRFAWRNELETGRDGHNLRCIFVASRTPLDTSALVPLLAPDTIIAGTAEPLVTVAEPGPDPTTAFAHRPDGWEQPLELLRRKWGTVPGGNHHRQDGAALLQMADQELLDWWERARAHDVEGAGFGVRGWYHEAYRRFIAGKKVLDIGCGMGLSTISFAEMGARLTFVDIVEDNTRIVQRICRLKGLEASVLYMHDFSDLDRLDDDYDVVTAVGSLINAPLAITKTEITAIKTHLRPGGRWLHFAYPKSRWEREGSPPYAQWGEMTGGPGTPWMEYHDRAKIEWLFAPSKIRLLFDCEWHDSDFNWFDIELLEH